MRQTKLFDATTAYEYVKRELYEYRYYLHMKEKCPSNMQKSVDYGERGEASLFLMEITT